MSQAKVDKYKDYKKNRKKILQREKTKETAEKVAVFSVISAVLVAVLVWIGSSAISSYKSYLASKPNYDRTSYVLSDLSGVLETETETEAE